MTAAAPPAGASGAEQDLVARAGDLADSLTDLADEITTIIARARSARVDHDALRGLAHAVNALGGDPYPALRDRWADRYGHYATDADMFEAIREIDDELIRRQHEAGKLWDEADTARRGARRERIAAQAELLRAMAMLTKRPCNGCHDAKAAAIARARERIDDARAREDLAAEALETLRGVHGTLAQAIAGVRHVADDYEDTYATELAKVRSDPDAMPKDGDFLTGYGSRLLPREVTGEAAALIRSVLQLAHGTDRTEEITARRRGATRPEKGAT